MPTAVESKLAPMTSHSDFFLKLGDIKGESLDDKHKGEIDLISFKFGVRQPGGAAAVGAAGGGVWRVGSNAPMPLPSALRG